MQQPYLYEHRCVNCGTGILWSFIYEPDIGLLNIIWRKLDFNRYVAIQLQMGQEISGVGLPMAGSGRDSTSLRKVSCNNCRFRGKSMKCHMDMQNPFQRANRNYDCFIMPVIRWYCALLPAARWKAADIIIVGD